MMEQPNAPTIEPSSAAPAPPPPQQTAAGAGLRTIILAAVLVAVIVIALVGYAAIGFAYSQTRISNADRSLNTVISHQNQLNTTFHEIDTNFTSLSTSSTFNPTAARNVVNQFVSASQNAGKTVDQDDASLATASSGLNDQGWLTVVNRGNVDRESNRIKHARAALADARSVSADYVLDGQYLQAFMDVLVDLDKLSTQSSAADLTGAQNTLTTMKVHVDKAVQLSTAPGLPPELHALTVDLQTLTTDFGKLVTAAQASDDAGVTAAETSVQNDANKISSYNFDTMSSEIDAFYKPMIDGFNSEMSAATS